MKLVLNLAKGGPYIGPRGGKWADAKHTIPWKEQEHHGAKYPMADRGEWYGDADYKARGGVIVAMSPETYLKRVAPLDPDDEWARDNIEDLKEHIRSGRTLDPLVIYANGKEDGRHRAYAAKELGIKKVPVILFGEQIHKGEQSDLPSNYVNHLMGPPPEPNRYPHPYVGTLNFQGLLVYVENAPGSFRQWPGGQTKMKCFYGEIPNTLGADNDPVDVYVGPDWRSEQVFVIHQKFWRMNDHTPAGTYDEDKVMLGFRTREEALRMYAAHFDHPIITPGITELTLGQLQMKIAVGELGLGAAIAKGGPFIGPRGGKWADPQHKVPWKGIADLKPHASAEHAPDPGQVERIAAALYEKLGEPVGKGRSAEIFVKTPTGTHAVRFEGATSLSAGFQRSGTVGGNVTITVPVGPAGRYRADVEALLAHELTHAADPALQKGSVDTASLHREAHAGHPAEAPAIRAEALQRLHKTHLDPALRPRKAAAAAFKTLPTGLQSAVRTAGVWSDVIKALEARHRGTSLAKAQKPPGGGWAPIPGGKKGGKRRKKGAGWEYWYPGQQQVKQAKRWERDPARTYKDLKAGDLIEVGGRRGIYRWTPDHGKAGEGRTWVQSQGSGAFELVRTSTLAPLRPAVKRAPPPPPKGGQKPVKVPSRPRKPGKRGTAKPLPPRATPKVPVQPVTGEEAPTEDMRRTKPFKGSTAKPGTVVAFMENGEAPLGKIKSAHDKRRHLGVHLTPSQQNQLATEMGPMMRGTARAICIKHGINPQENRAAYEDVLSGCYQGMVMAVNNYTGGKSFRQSAKLYAQTYGLSAAKSVYSQTSIPDRVMRMSHGFIAARVRATGAKGGDPTREQVAAAWRVKKGDITRHSDLGHYSVVNDEGETEIINQSTEELPDEDWQLLDAQGHPTGPTFPGKLTMISRLEQVTRGNNVSIDELQAELPSDLLPGEAARGMPAAMAVTLRQDLNRVMAKLPEDHRQVLAAKFGLDGGEPKTNTEIAQMLKVPGSSATLKRKGAEAVNTALRAAMLIANDMPALKPHLTQWGQGTARSRVNVEAIDAPSLAELKGKFGSYERARVYLQAVRAGHGPRTSQLLEAERDGKLTPAQSEDVRKQFYAERDEERLRMFRQQTRHRVVDAGPSDRDSAAGETWNLGGDTILTEAHRAILKRGST